MDNIFFIGKVIKDFRKQQHLSQTELADGICSKDYLYAIEKGKHEPSLYILERLSKRLNVDLFEYLTDISNHFSLETHNRYVGLNSFLFSGKYDGLREYISECEKDPSFENGEPFLLLLYSKATLAFNEEDFNLSLEYCKQGIQVMNISMDFDEQFLSELTNVEILLIKLYAINLHTLGREREAYKVYTLLYHQFHFVTNRPAYELNKAIHFQAVIFLIVSYNLAIFNADNRQYDKAEQLITEALELINKIKSIDMMIPLLLCYVDVCYNTNRLAKAQEIFDDIPIILKYCGEKIYYEHFLEDMKEYLPLLKTDKHKVV